MVSVAVGGVAPGLAPSAQGLPAYAELHCRSNFTFLTGASHPEELVARAHELGYTRAGDHRRVLARRRGARTCRRPSGCGLHLIVGAEMRLTPSAAGGATVRAWCSWRSRAAATATSRSWITVARRRAAKGSYQALVSDLEGRVPQAPIWPACPAASRCCCVDAASPFETLFAQAMWLKTWFGGERAALAVRAAASRRRRVAASRSRSGRRAHRPAARRRRRRADARALAQAAAGRADRDAAGASRSPNAASRSSPTPRRTCVRAQRLAGAVPARMAGEPLRASPRRCAFSLDELRYEYPRRDRARRPHAGELAARAHRGAAHASAFRDGVPQGAQADRARAGAHRASSATSRTS